MVFSGNCLLYIKSIKNIARIRQDAVSNAYWNVIIFPPVYIVYRQGRNCNNITNLLENRETLEKSYTFLMEYTLLILAV